jgi:hypothetical protein
LGKEVVFQVDTAFAKPEIEEASEGWGVKYGIRIPSSENLERDIGELLTRPVGRMSILRRLRGVECSAIRRTTDPTTLCAGWAKEEFHAGRSIRLPIRHAPWSQQ